MEKQLAEVVDGTEIKEITETQNLCSCENDGASNMVSSENNDACGGNNSVAESLRQKCRKVMPI
ncbi:hypothetical protein [Sinanaerobacter chloroacetimidivorans]|uniref:Uncharacterized protein n=1 Tax=Sinanaerobacter chloroacetimidivorans TaxID=2818044 RepID=A0A8J8B2F9_9FIRM|nr:hypothetical protein [Sinanaerobacter chloroacetimidivorans]MBR0599768.1 hypothetical protein [Sinanaerobacter chloroacetimidivorans]